MGNTDLSKWIERFPDKFATEDGIFSRINRGDRIFIGTGCGEPEYLVNALINYLESHPKAFAEAEVIHVWTHGIAPFADERFNYNFRHNSFFVSNSTRDSVNQGLSDYTPVFISEVPRLIQNRTIPIDIALIQTSLPDENGFVSLGISVDITKTAVENASLVIAQLNSNMPRVHGDSFINIKDINYFIHKDAPLLQFSQKVPDEIAEQIAQYVARIVRFGDTLQIGYGSLPNAVLPYLKDKKNLGLHTELLTDSVIDLIKSGVINNSKKNVDKGISVASFCMGTEDTYRFIDDNPMINFRTVEYTNSPLVMSRINYMTAINSALQIDLTGQATAESIGSTVFSGIGGTADFMRGARLAPGGKSILAMQSTGRGGEVSRIVPFLESGTGVTLNRGDISYVVTEYGIAYIHGKNIRERAMDLISIAHPKFRPWLIDEAKGLNLIYKDQAFIPGKEGEYPKQLETVRTTKSGLSLFIRPVKINDESLIKDFFYSLSDTSLQRRFMSYRKDVPHRMRQKFVVVDHTKETLVLACVDEDKKEVVVGIGQSIKNEDLFTAEVGFAVRDDYQRRGIAYELLLYLTTLARKEGLHGFTAEVLIENVPMLSLFDKMGYDIKKTIEAGVCSLQLRFKDQPKIK